MLEAFLVKSNTAWKAAGRGLNIPMFNQGSTKLVPKGRIWPLGSFMTVGRRRRKELSCIPAAGCQG